MYAPSVGAVKPRPSSYTMGAKHREPRDLGTPGPGAYTNSATNPPFGSEGPKVSMSQRLADGRNAMDSFVFAPAPGQYNPDISRVRPMSPRYTIAPKVKDLRTLAVPGPGSYNPTALGSPRLDRRQPSYAMGAKGPSQFGRPTVGPGPGLYEPHTTRTGRSASPSFTIYAKVREPARLAVPGPGSYNSNPGAVKPSSRAVTMGAKTFDPWAPARRSVNYKK